MNSEWFWWSENKNTQFGTNQFDKIKHFEVGMNPIYSR